MSELRTNKIYPRDGLPAGASSGGIIQTVTNSYQTETIITAAATYTPLTGASITIKPSSLSSKIIFEYNLQIWVRAASASSCFCGVRVKRGSNVIYTPHTPSGGALGSPEYGLSIGGASSSSLWTRGSLKLLDTPGSTSNVTYTLEATLYATTGSAEAYFNYDGYATPATSFLHLTEVCG